MITLSEGYRACGSLSWCTLPDGLCLRDENQGCDPVTWASVGTSFPLGLTLPPAPEGRKRFVFCLKDMGLCQVQPSPKTLATISQLPDQNGEGREWGIHSGKGAGVIVFSASSLCSVIWRQAEIAEPRRLTTVYSVSEGRGRGHAAVFTSSPTSCGWSLHAEIQWLHQTPLTHILSCLIGKAIKPESSRAPWLSMIYFDFSVSSHVTSARRLNAFYQYIPADFCNIFSRIKCDLTNWAQYYSSL